MFNNVHWRLTWLGDTVIKLIILPRVISDKGLLKNSRGSSLNYSRLRIYLLNLVEEARPIIF